MREEKKEKTRRAFSREASKWNDHSFGKSMEGWRREGSHNSVKSIKSIEERRSRMGHKSSKSLDEGRKGSGHSSDKGLDEWRKGKGHSPGKGLDEWRKRSGHISSKSLEEQRRLEKPWLYAPIDDSVEEGKATRANPWNPAAGVIGERYFCGQEVSARLSPKFEDDGGQDGERKAATVLPRILKILDECREQSGHSSTKSLENE